MSVAQVRSQQIVPMTTSLLSDYDLSAVHNSKYQTLTGWMGRKAFQNISQNPQTTSYYMVPSKH